MKSITTRIADGKKIRCHACNHKEELHDLQTPGGSNISSVLGENMSTAIPSAGLNICILHVLLYQ